MFNKILIANRGEIACRIIRTAKRLGIETVAIHADIEATALHVELADEAYCVGAAPSRDSYLQVDKIIQIAKDSGAQAIHPGYGFLSENTELAKACSKENITFIGPSVSAIKAMGSKSAAKTIMEKAKVATIPGYHGDNQDPVYLQSQADLIGYPILLKAVAGGGGKGMRVVESSKQFSQALESAKREAKSSFANDDILIEKYLAQPRHIEIQILADQHGNVIDLAERDCSIQRRHQKIVEEAPAPMLSDLLRNKLAQAAIAAAKAIDYLGAGTIEFLVEGDDFYFMEMNTRLQVEHGITEMITALDIVEWQLRVACGESIKDLNITVLGHAIEARIYAEDPYQDFLPVTGKVSYLQAPSDTHIRIDTGIREGDEVSIYYDPMISKLMVWALKRDKAIQALNAALSQYFIAGVTTNIDFLKTVIQHPAFISGDYSTNFISEHPELLKLTTNKALNFAIASVYLQLSQALEDKPYSPWSTNDNWRLNSSASQTFYFLDNGKNTCTTIEENNNHFVIRGDTETIFLKAMLQNGELTIEHEHHHYHLTIVKDEERLTLFGLPAKQEVICFDPIKHYSKEEACAGHLAAPMPGTVVAVLIEDGKQVDRGDQLITIEAMKMEHTIVAPSAGTVTDVYFKIGDTVAEGDQLLGFDSN